MVIWHFGLSEQLSFHFLHRDVAQGARNCDSFEDVIFNAVGSALILSFSLFFEFVHDLFQLLQFLASFDAEGDDELEEVPVREGVDSFLAEEIIDIGDVSSQEVQRVGVVVFYGLRDIDHPDFVLVVEHVVLAEICVDELAFLVQNSHYFYDLQIDLGPLFDVGNLGVFESRGVLHVLPDEVHD